MLVLNELLQILEKKNDIIIEEDIGVDVTNATTIKMQNSFDWFFTEQEKPMKCSLMLKVLRQMM